MESELNDNHSLIASRAFYRAALAIAVPMMIQNGITNFVGMLDNVMVGRVGTDAMSGVSIVNQLLFVYYLCIFGGVSGVGIFTAQFWGKRDMRGMQYTMRAKLLLGLFLSVAGICVLTLGGQRLIGAFLHEGGSTGSIDETMRQAQRYLRVMIFGLLPMAITNVYASTLRESGQTVVPMRAGIIAVFVNLVFNYILIYGKFGAPRLGVAGAAAATVISRFVELFIVALWTHRHPDRNPYIRGCYRSLYVPRDLVKRFVVKGMPLLCNEALWSAGATMLVQCYSVRGLTAVAALNISNTLGNLFNIVCLSMGNATAILLGQRLGSGETEGARLFAFRLAAFSVFLSTVTAVVLFFAAPFFPLLYNTTDEVRSLAAGLLRVSACVMPFFAFGNNAYFTLRSGGNTLITFLFDSCSCWAVAVPLALILSRRTAMPVLWMFTAVQALEIIKCTVGGVLVGQGRWIRDLTSYADRAQ